MLLSEEINKICMDMLKNVKYAKICKISLHICNQDFMNQIYILLWYKSGSTKKICKIINIRALLITFNKQFKL